MPYRFVADGGARKALLKQHTVCPVRFTIHAHLVDGEKIGALGSVRVVPLQTLVHVCFALAKLARQTFVARQNERRVFKAPVTVNKQGLEASKPERSQPDE